MNIKINASGGWSTKRIALGAVGEHMFRVVSIDASEWAAEYEGCSFALVYRRPDKMTYPVAIVVTDDNVVRWRITAADVAVAGVGTLELRLLLDGEIIGKTTTVLCDVAQSITDDNDPPPDPAPEWLDTVAQSASTALMAASDAEQSAQEAREAAATVAQSASTALMAASDAEQSAQEAREAAASIKLGYVHIQIAAATTWDITHDLDKYPSVTVVDSGGNVVVGDVEYLTTSHIRVHFSAEFSGKAYLN